MERTGMDQIGETRLNRECLTTIYHDWISGGVTLFLLVDPPNCWDIEHIDRRRPPEAHERNERDVHEDRNSFWPIGFGKLDHLYSISRLFILITGIPIIGCSSPCARRLQK